jgi:hypothetical protein
VRRLQADAFYPPIATAAQKKAPSTTVLKTGTIDWPDWWAHETNRRELGELPNKGDYLTEARILLRYRYRAKSIDESMLRLFTAALYRGDTKRPVRTKKQKTPPR